MALHEKEENCQIPSYVSDVDMADDEESPNTFQTVRQDKVEDSELSSSSMEV